MSHETFRCLEKFTDIVLLQSQRALDVSSIRPVAIENIFHDFPLDNVDVEVESMYDDDDIWQRNVEGVDITTVESLQDYWPTADEQSFSVKEITEEYDRRIKIAEDEAPLNVAKSGA